MRIVKSFRLVFYTAIASILFVPGVRAQWSASGGNIYPTTLSDKVGINTNSPNAQLDVNGTMKIKGADVDPSIRVDDGVYVSLQPHFEGSGFPNTIYTGSLGTFVDVDNASVPFNRVMRCSSILGYLSDMIPVQAGESLYGEIWAMRESGSSGSSGDLYCGIARYDKDKNPIASNQGLNYFVASGATVPQNGIWTKYSGTTELPLTHTPYAGSDGSAVRYIQLCIIVNYSGGTIPTYWGGAILRRVAPCRGDGPVAFNGNVGIGLSSPGQKLSIGGSTGGNQDLIGLFPSDNNAAVNRIIWSRPGDNWTPAAIGQIYSPVGGYGGQLAFYTKTDDGYAGTAPTEKMRLLANGNLGIGTSTPQVPLHVNGVARATLSDFMEGSSLIGFLGRGGSYTGGWSGLPDALTLTYASRDFAIGGWRKSDGVWGGPRFFIDSDNGNIGIGTTAPQAPLHVIGIARATVTDFMEGSSFIGFLGRGGSYTGGWSDMPNALTLTYASRDFAIGGWRKSDSTWGGPRFFIDSDNGNVGIGTTSPGERLMVNGNIVAKKVKVTQTGWPDYVFKDTYALSPLTEVEAYIKKHGHLQGIPAAAIVEKEGHDLGEMDKLLLQKVEELTLYVISLSKENEAIRAELTALKKQPLKPGNR